MSRLPRGSKVVTASAGNHAIGVAWASELLGHDATIVVPSTASPRKLAILEDMGAHVIRHGTSFEEAEAYALDLANDGIRFVSAYNDPHVIAGQGTIVDEMLDRIEGNFTIYVPVGGGGLVSGIAIRAAMIRDRDIRVIGVEAETSMALSAAVHAGQTVDVEIHDSLADGLVGNLETGAITADIMRSYGTELITVSERQIEDAIRTLYLRHDLRVEGAGAAAFAGMKAHPVEGDMVAIVSGRNIDEQLLQDIVARR